ncbi:NAD(P)/FAD-dependent oxidoreductase [Mycolicibacterium komossense]|uniref:NAD(P)/FAD-dependent oxidoreductase n=1 Tax=Mycolicibacterium komossense TaxID=1779 RepID=A0ABT3C696_9MYCO|nr:NAD(P)/FAD-dependent oxidoreductase [Mycolicibacterium komossense]MCV7224999.1 NAD(P)/FAD-dependent oxidoreductase [Mycolicibacterium komossense]
MDIVWDCVIVGGGAAGLSAGLVLGRARRRTLIVDAGQQSNLSAHGIGGLLGSDGRPPAELYAAGRVELSAYPSVEVRDGEVVSGARAGDEFVLTLDTGEQVRSRRVLLATGMQYRPPVLPGLAELWGGSVFHCPFCHGWEVREQPLAVLAAGQRGVHSALLLRGWSDDIVLLTDGPSGLGEDDVARLAAADVRVDERPVTEVRGAAGQLTSVVFADGTELPRRGMLVGTMLYQRSTLAEQLGAEPAEPGPVAADAVRVDPFARTTAPGVFAAGDVSAQMPQVAAAVAAGALAAAAIMQTLMADDYGLPLPTGGDARVGTR